MRPATATSCSWRPSASSGRTSARASAAPDLFEQHPGSKYADHAVGDVALRAELRTIFGTRTSAEWLEFGGRVNTPIAPVNTPRSIADDAQFRDRMPWIPQERLGAEQLPLPIKLIDGELPLPTMAPTVGQHTDEVLRDVLGYDEARVATLRVRSPRMSASPADHEDAARFAEEAGRLLLGIRARIDDGEAVDLIRHEGDLRSHELLLARLTEAHPDDAVLSEEGADDLARLDAERVWIVDPLDGTREFGEPPRTDWAVHVALVIGGEPVAGAVALPAGAWCSPPPRRRRWRRRRAGDLVVSPLDSRKKPTGWSRPSVRSWWRWGRQARRPWRSCSATPTSIRTRGASTSGTPPRRWRSRRAPACTSRASTARRLRYNQRDAWLPDLLICRPELAEPVLAALA